MSALSPLLFLTLFAHSLPAAQDTLSSASDAQRQCLETSDFESSLTCHIEEAMAELQDIPGLAVAVVRDSGTIYERGFGQRDREARQEVTPETVFYIASHSKALTGMTAALLAHKGVLELDAPIARYLLELSFRDPGLSADSITVRDLLTHTSGILNPAITWRTSYTGQYTAEDLVRILGEHSRPGSRSFRYTNVGYVIVGVIFQRLKWSGLAPCRGRPCSRPPWEWIERRGS